jgi:hypothetical protein
MNWSQIVQAHTYQPHRNEDFRRYAADVVLLREEDHGFDIVAVYRRVSVRTHPVFRLCFGGHADPAGDLGLNQSLDSVMHPFSEK